MARVTLPAGIERISGRMGNVCFRTMKATGKIYVTRMPHVRATIPTKEEMARRERFGKTAQLVNQMRKAGSPLSRKQLWQLAAQAL